LDPRRWRAATRGLRAAWIKGLDRMLARIHAAMYSISGRLYAAVDDPRPRLTALPHQLIPSSNQLSADQLSADQLSVDRPIGRRRSRGAPSESGRERDAV